MSDKEKILEFLRNGGSAKLDFEGGDFNNMYLKYAVLSEVNLKYADFSNTNLMFANLSYSDLSHSKLISANLRCADLNHTNLKGANLSNADLSFANLNSAVLADCNFTGTDLTGTVLQDSEVSSNDSMTSNQSLIDALKYIETVDGIKITLIFVKGGAFNMGSNSADEKPVHEVVLDDFYIGETLVTQELWRTIMGYNPSQHKDCDQCPVERISWNDIQIFLKRLNNKINKQYRLPTEAEWEYAAMGGNLSKGYRYSGSDNIDEVAWHRGNSGHLANENLVELYAPNKILPGITQTHPVKLKRPNELGIFDMSGNVWERCKDIYDIYSPSSQTNPQGPSTGWRRVHRGGSFINHYISCRIKQRNHGSPMYYSACIGFRIAHSI